MLVSFASVAVSLWLGLVAIACLHGVWRAVAHHESGQSDRDYGHSTRGERYRHHRWGDSASEGLIPIGWRSAVGLLLTVTHGFRATLGRIGQWISKMLRPSAATHTHLSQSFPVPSGIANASTPCLKASVEGDTPKTLAPNSPEVATKCERVTRESKQISKTSRESSQSKQGRISRQGTETDRASSRKLPKARAQKKTPTVNRSLRNTAKKTARTKPKVSAVSKLPSIPKINV